MLEKKKKIIKKIYKLNMLIKADHVGKIWVVYNGRKFTKIVIEASMVGLKLGNLIFTRKNSANIHVKEKKKKKK